MIFAVWQSCPDGANSFWDAINALHAGKWSRTQTGFQITATTGSGFSQSFHVPMSTADPSNMSDSQLQDTFYSIIEAYQLVQTQYGLDEGVAGNPAFLNQLLAEFPTVKGYTPNFMFVQT